MLFNSLVYILLFLPLSAFVYYSIAKLNYAFLNKSILIFFSLFFYAWWDYNYLFLILSSIAFNYFLGFRLIEQHKKDKKQHILLVIGITLNLLILIYYKYLNFFVETVNNITEANLSINKIALPLAISFFTFQQIAYLVDSFQGKVKDKNFIDYLLFVCFFPQLISGPIVHHSQLIPQFKNLKKIFFSTIAPGMTIFIIGLSKKVLIADNMSAIADKLFYYDYLDSLSAYESWIGTLAYTFEIYFDFSGYSDMAVGSALIFGIYLPINFSSPYKTQSIISFWRAWHITLSAFLKNYLYIPLGGNRKGTLRKYCNLFITMLLGGLWHGASFQFIFWGMAHGIYLIINHLYRNYILAFFPNSFLNSRMYKHLAWLITFIAVVSAWVFFKANEFQDSVLILKAMYGLGSETNIFNIYESKTIISFKVAVVLLIAFFMPNSNQIIGFQGNSIGKPMLRYNYLSFLLFFILLLFCILKLMTSGYEEFIYRFF